MRLRLLAWLTGLALAGALLAPTAALAADTETIHLSGTESMPDVNPCSGATGTRTTDFQVVFHSTALDNGTFHITGTLTGTISFVPNDPSQPTYTGHVAEQFAENENSRNFTHTETLNVVLQGSDGSRQDTHGLIHFTVNANGTLTSAIEILRVTCL
jgi:hypothetical protein